MQHFEKLEVNLAPESIYMKEECGIKKHTEMWAQETHRHIYTYIYIWFSIVKNQT